MPESDIKKYLYKETEYILNPVTLGVLKYAAPLIAKLRKLQHEYTAGINMEKVSSAKQRIMELSTAIKQLEEELKSSSANEQSIGELNRRIDSLRETLSNEKSSLESSVEMQNTLRLYNECLALAALEVISDTELVNGFIGKAVKSVADDNTGTICLDINDPRSVDFVKEVLADFFYLIAGKVPAPADLTSLPKA